jgi:hypothetical protein
LEAVRDALIWVSESTTQALSQAVRSSVHWWHSQVRSVTINGNVDRFRDSLVDGGRCSGDGPRFSDLGRCSLVSAGVCVVTARGRAECAPRSASAREGRRSAPWRSGSAGRRLGTGHRCPHGSGPRFD